MEILINIFCDDYTIHRRFHVLVPRLFIYLIKSTGTEAPEKKEHKDVLKSCKGKHRKVKRSIMHHIHRKVKKHLKYKTHSHES